MQEYPTIDRVLKSGATARLTCPTTEVDYQQFMGAVDMANRLLMLYSMMRKSYKWWKKLFWFYLEVCIVDSHVVYSMTQSDKLDLLAFRAKLAEELIGGRIYRARAGRPSSGPVSDRLLNPGEHYLEWSESRPDCVVCSTVGKKNGLDYRDYRKKTHYVCNGPGCG